MYAVLDHAKRCMSKPMPAQRGFSECVKSHSSRGLYLMDMVGCQVYINSIRLNVGMNPINFNATKILLYCKKAKNKEAKGYRLTDNDKS
jgi:hypothetical protein